MNAKSTLLIVLILFALLVNVSQVRSQFHLDVKVRTDKGSYIKRQLVNVTGNVTYQGELVDNGLIGIQVENPLTTTILRALPLNPTQSFPFSIKITSLLPVDDYGVFKPSTERGKYMWFNMTVKNKGLSPKPVLVSITVLDSGLIPLDIDTASFTIQPGQTNAFMPRMYIPNWATLGTAYIHASVYNEWPDLLGYPLCPEKTSYFSIIESIYYDEPPNATSPTQHNENGTYEMNFRLPPDMIPGTYQVSASAWSPSTGGFTGFSSKGFEANYVPSPPWPSFVIKPPMAPPNYTITFDASSSSAEGYNDTITGYFWTFGDGKNKTGKVVTHSYTHVGNYTVALNVTDLEGFWNTTSREIAIMMIHDVAIIDIESLERIYNDWSVSVKVTIKNEGTYHETFNVELYANSTIIQTKQVSNLGPVQTQTLTFTWNTTDLTLLANYTLQAIAEILENETDTSDNSLDFGPVFVTMIGDIMFNRKIDLYDAVALLKIYGVKEGNLNWDIMMDLVRDGAINLYDAVKLLTKYGITY